MFAAPRDARVELASRARTSPMASDQSSRVLGYAVALADLALWMGVVPMQVMQSLLS